jgi:ribosomal protein L44E
MKRLNLDLTCDACGQTKHWSLFGKNEHGVIYTTCFPCRRERSNAVKRKRIDAASRMRRIASGWGYA